MLLHNPIKLLIIENRVLIQITLLAFIFTIFTGCAATKINKPITQEFISQQKNVVVRSIVLEKTIVQVEKPEKANTITGTGLLDVALDTMINAAEDAIKTHYHEKNKAQAEKWIKKAKKDLEDINVAELYWNELQSALLSSVWASRITKIERERVYIDGTKIDRIEENNLLFSTTYSFSEDFSVFIVSTRAWYFVPGNDTHSYFGGATYYSDPLEQAGGEAAIEWIKNNAAKYRNAVTKGISENIKMLNIDVLNPDKQNEEQEPVEVTIRSPFTGDKVTYEGPILERESDRIIIQPKGLLFSLPVKMIIK